MGSTQSQSKPQSQPQSQLQSQPQSHLQSRSLQQLQFPSSSPPLSKPIQSCPPQQQHIKILTPNQLILSTTPIIQSPQFKQLAPIFHHDKRCPYEIYKLSFEYMIEGIHKLFNLTPFYNLKELELNFGCHPIGSLENISGMYMPSLEKFAMNFTRVVSLRPMRKAFMPQIREIDLSDGMWNQTDYMKQFYVGKTKLEGKTQIILCNFREKRIQKIHNAKIYDVKIKFIDS